MKNRLKAASLRRRKAASGQAVIESIGSIILFTILLAIMMTMVVYLYFQQALVTAAREGARQAALNSSLGNAATQNTGISYVQQYVKDEVKSLTGQTYDASKATITVTPPTGVQGQRTVNVTITWRIQNPLAGVTTLIGDLGGNGNAFNWIPVSAGASMRYEE